MKMTMLEMVQNIMSALDSDEIDSITDTVEGEQVAAVIRDTYWQLVTNKTIPEHQALFQLTNAGGTAKVFMLIPTTVRQIEWLKYNKIEDGGSDTVFADVQYLDPESFMNLLLRRKSSDTNTVSATDPNSSIALDQIINDAPPSYWTSFDDQYVVFDSYDAVVDASGLVASKTLCWGVVEPTFTIANSTTNSFTPDLDDHLFPLLLAEAKSTCFVNIKQSANPKVDKQAREQRFSMQNDKYRTKASQEENFNASAPDYGRRPRR